MRVGHLGSEYALVQSSERVSRLAWVYGLEQCQRIAVVQVVGELHTMAGILEHEDSTIVSFSVMRHQDEITSRALGPHGFQPLVELRTNRLPRWEVLDEGVVKPVGLDSL